MGDCVFCGKPAGIFKSRHKECALADEAAKAKERERVVSLEREQADFVQASLEDAFLTVKNGGDLAALEMRLLDAVAAEKLDRAQMSEMFVKAWEKSVDAFLDDGLLDPEEESKLAKCQERFLLTQEKLNRNGKFMRVAKSGILRRVMAGEIPSNVDVDHQGMVNLQRGETLVWLFNRAQYLEDIVRKQVVGRSQGMSFRIMSGVYYRVGGFKGESISTLERKNLGTGVLLVTDKNLYFVGPGKTTRIPYSKVVSFTPYSDAVGLMRDTLSAKPQFFVVDDAWFAFNLITNLAKIH